MSALGLHVLVAAAGLALALLGAGFVLRRWEKRPVAGYRLLSVVLLASLLLPGLQLALHAAGPALPWRLAPAAPAPSTRTAVSSGEPTGPGAPADAGGPAGLRAGDVLLVLALLAEPDRALPQRADEAVVLDEATTAHVVPAPERPELVALAREALDLWGRTWIAGALLFGLVAARRLVRTADLLRAAQPVRDPALLAAWRTAAGDARRARETRLLVTDELAAPACFGLVRRSVLLPADAAEWERDALVGALRHELVHLERRDTWIQLLTELQAALFWFHPGTTWLRRRLDALRELSCDAVAVRRAGGRRRYASALVEAAARVGRRHAGLADRRPTAALAPWTHPSIPLAKRIEMLLSKETDARPLRATLFPVAAGLGLLATAQLALASALAPAPQDAPPSPPAPAVDPVPASAPSPPSAPFLAASPALRAPLAPLASEPADPGFEPWAEPVPEPTEPALAPTPPFAQRGGFPRRDDAPFGRHERRDSYFGNDPAPRTGLVGFLIEPVGPALAAQVGEPAEHLILVGWIAPGSAADRAGLETWDVITSIDGAPAHAEALQAAKERLAEGEPVTVTVQRAGRSRTLEVSGPVDLDEEAARELHRRARERHGLRPGASDQRFGPSRDWYDDARRYYEAVDPERYREDLRRARESYHEALKGARLGRDAQRGLERLEALDDDELRRHLDGTRRWLERTDQDDLRRRVDSLRKAPRPPGTRPDDDRRDGARRYFDSARDHASRQLEKKERELHDLERQLEALSRKLESLRSDRSER